jgi:glutamate synthase domain-containing protein 3
VERFLREIAQDVRVELGRAGFRSLADALGRADRLTPDARSPLRLDALCRPPRWTPSAERRSDPTGAARVVRRPPASPAERDLSASYSALPSIAAEDGLAVEWPLPRAPLAERADGAVTHAVSTADRAFGAETSGLIERRVIRRPVDWALNGAAGQSFGAFAGPGVRLVLEGQANDYVGKGLSGGVVVVRPEPSLLAAASDLAIVGNTCLYGATGGRLHVVGRAGIRFAVRNSGADAVVEGAGAHACEYMTGGVVVLLGPVGRNLGAGMTGGRVYLHDPDGGRLAGLATASVAATRLGQVVAERADGLDRLDELRVLLRAQRDAGSRLAERLLDAPVALADTIWLVEPLDVVRVAQETAAATVSQPKDDPGRADVRSRVA